MKFAACLLLVTLPFASVLAQGDNKPEAYPLPKVELSEQHKSLVKVVVGDTFPEISLPTPDQGGDPLAIAQRFGSKATVVTIFGSESPMSKSMLRDLQIDISEGFDPPGAAREKAVLATVAIASGISDETAKKVVGEAGCKSLLLLDSDGMGFENLGQGRMPRVYVLDSEGKIVWFDIEYSSATRREMKQAVRAMLK